MEKETKKKESLTREIQKGLALQLHRMHWSSYGTGSNNLEELKYSMKAVINVEPKIEVAGCIRRARKDLKMKILYFKQNISSPTNLF